MSLRAVTVAAVLVVAAAPVAQAAPARPSCRLVVDRPGDAEPTAGPAAALDLLSADVATDRSYITTVVRVPQLPAGGAGSPTAAYHVSWRYGAFRFQTIAATTAAGRSFRAAAGRAEDDVMTDLETALTGVFDTARGEARLSFPRAALLAAAPGATGPFHDFRVEAREIPPLTVPQFGTLSLVGAVADTAEEPARTYRLGARSCVTPGR